MGKLLVSVPTGADPQPTHYNSFNRESLEELITEFFTIWSLHSDFGAFYCVALKTNG
jgi:hypothetical protein